jgi:hypothetical protein
MLPLDAAQSTEFMLLLGDFKGRYPLYVLT